MSVYVFLHLKKIFTASDGHSTFHVAAGYGDLDVIKKFMDTYKLQNERDAEGETVLHEAAKFGQLDIIKFIVTHQDYQENVTDVDYNGETPLHEAVKHDHLDVVKFLMTDSALKSAKSAKNS